MTVSAPQTMDQAVRDDQQVRHELLSRTWCKPPGFWGWFMNVHHTAIGVRYMVTSFIFFLLGGVLAAMMRLQLSAPESNLLGPDKYNQFFTVARQHHDFFVCRAHDVPGFRRLPRALNVRRAKHRVPAAQRFQLLHLFGWRSAAVDRPVSQHRRGCGMVRLRSTLRPAIFSRQARRFLGPDDYLHRSFRAGGRHLYRHYHPALSRPRHDPQPHAHPALGKTGPFAHGDFRHARRDGRQQHASTRSLNWHPVL